MDVKYLKEFSMKRVFDFEFVVSLTGNKVLANMTLQNYLSKGYIKRVKKNLYVTISLENSGIIPTKFEIASNITKSSFVSYHSAFEFYGYYNQIHHEVFISSIEQFRPFSFEYNEYTCKRVDDIRFVETINGVKVSPLAKTIVDLIDNVKTYDNIEEFIEILTMIPAINGADILAYLKYVNKKILFSKTGLILSLFKDGYNITNNQLLEMKRFGVDKSRDFTSEKHRLNKYYPEWKLHAYDLSKMKVESANEDL